MTNARHRLAKISLNAFSILGGDVLNKAGIFLVYAMIARQAGVHEFGQLSLGLLLLYTFHVFAVAGLPVSLTREVAKHPASAKRLLLHGYLASLLPSMLSMLAMIALAMAMQYERDTVMVITLLTLAVPFYALTMITEAVIKGREQMHLIPIGNLPGNMFLVVASFLVLRSGYGVAAVAGVVVISRLLTLVSMHWLFHINHRDCRRGRIHPRFSWMLLKHSMVFLGSDGIQAIGASTFGLLLSKFATETEVGLLSASFQLLQPIQMAYRSVGHSAFPPLVSAARSSGKAVGELGRTIIGLMLRLAFPAALVVFCLADDLLVTVYGNESFHAGSLALQILAFTLLLDPMNPILGHGLWAMGRDRVVLRIVMVNVLTNIVVGFVLIWQFGLLGAAASVLVASFVNMVQHYWCFERDVDHLHLGRELLSMSPAVAAAIACIILLPIHPYAGLLSALLVYVVIAYPRFETASIRGQVS